MYGPVRTVVWQGSAGDRRPYADLTGNTEVGREGPNKFKLDDHPSTTTQRTENISLLPVLNPVRSTWVLNTRSPRMNVGFFNRSKPQVDRTNLNVRSEAWRAEIKVK